MSHSIYVGVVRDHLSDDNIQWWFTTEDPFQIFMSCAKVSDAIGFHGGGATIKFFQISLHIAMEESCNELQHSAALGLNVSGGELVNLVPSVRSWTFIPGFFNLVSDKVN